MNIYIVLSGQSQQQSTLNQFLLARLAKPISIARAQTQDLDMVAALGAREGQDRRREEHGLVVRVRDQQADALVAQRGHSGLRHGGCVDVEEW